MNFTVAFFYDVIRVFHRLFAYKHFNYLADIHLVEITCGIALFDKRLVYKRIGRHRLSVQLLADKHKLCLLYISVIVRCSACKVGLCKLILISARMRAEITQRFPVSVGEE